MTSKRAKKQPDTRVPVTQPLTEDYYSTHEGDVEDIEINETIEEEMRMLGQVMKMKNPQHRNNAWRSFLRSQAADDPEPEKTQPAFRGKPVDPDAPLSRPMHKPFVPVAETVPLRSSSAIEKWISKQPLAELLNADPDCKLPETLLSEAEALRPGLEAEINRPLNEARRYLQQQAFHYDSTVQHSHDCSVGLFISTQLCVALIERDCIVRNYLFFGKS